MKKLLFVFALLILHDWAWGDSNVPAELRVEVRASQSLFEPFSNEAAIKIYLRCTAAGYLTLYHIHPDSGLAILYPRPHHHWRELEAKKEYRLAELAEDLELQYRELDGYVYLGVIATREPIHLVPWLEQAFSERGVKLGEKPEKSFADEIEALIEKVESDVRFRMGESNPSSFALIPLLLKPRTQLLAGDWHEARKPQRYFFEGRYHYVAPEPPRNFPNPLMRTPSPFPQRDTRSGASTIAPPVTKEKPNNVKPARQEKKN